MDLLRSYALSFLLTPYKWGGSGFDGIDCSGFVQEILKSVGLDPAQDQTAQGLFDHFNKTGEWNSYRIGSLAFYGESVLKITHVAFLLDPYRVIEAAGGGSKCLSREDATRENAFVRIRLIKYRADLVAVIRPRYSTIGLI
jgi:cell wall-associated NlpC family hydrolase